MNFNRYAWANPRTGVREQDDNLIRAIGRIQEDLKLTDMHSVILYQQTPRASVERAKAHSIAPRKRTRLADWIRFHSSSPSLRRQMQIEAAATPHRFTGITEGVADRPCTTCGLPDRAEIHKGLWD